MFKDELGTLSYTAVKICVEPNAVPRFFKWSVPFAMKHKVEKKLERLQHLGIIESIQFSDWAAPIVPVLKDDGTVCICGDYKLTINQAANLRRTLFQEWRTCSQCWREEKLSLSST